jgi:hypothetical protein
MKRLFAAALALGLAGCYATATPYGVFIEPLADIVVTGPPVVVSSPPSVVFQPLPPVYVVPDRRVYRYDNHYYYYWGDSWYWGRDHRGPWHPLDRRYWPPRTEPSHGHHDNHGKGKGGSGHH